MDLGIKGRKALICGGSDGIGFACADLLAAEGVDLVLIARNPEKLSRAAETLQARHGVAVEGIIADLAEPEARRSILDRCPDPDILIHNGGWPKTERDFRKWTREDWLRATDLMMLAPIELITGVIDGMAERKFGRVVAVTSRFVKEPHSEVGLSISPRLGLSGFVTAVARKYAASNVTLNTALPGIIATQTQVQHANDLAVAQGKSFDQIWAERSATNSANRFASPEEFASLCVFMCAANSGFLTGQHVLSDGGGYPGVF